VKNNYKLPKNYILFLSTLKPSKNIDGLVDAFAKITDKFPEFKLVIAGKKGWLFESVFKKVKELKLEDKVLFTDFVPEEDKPALLKGAKTLVSPSFWEGFGIHVLEAMACGTPVIVSNIASFPEVVGKAGIYVDPKNTIDVARGIETVLKMQQKEYNELVKKGYRQAVRFSWEKTARETVKIFEEA
jgi:glycosyltransferase involved in cell wall biosynthesis